MSSGTAAPDSPTAGPAGGGSAGPGFTPTVPPQDLSCDTLVANATWMVYLGARRPTLGGVHLLAKLGQGGIDAVYYAINPRLGSEVAVKVLPFHFAGKHPETIERFFREARMAARVKSPHLVAVQDVDEEGWIFYPLMEFLCGLSTRTKVVPRAA